MIFAVDQVKYKLPDIFSFHSPTEKKSLAHRAVFNYTTRGQYPSLERPTDVPQSSLTLPHDLLNILPLGFFIPATSLKVF